MTFEERLAADLKTAMLAKETQTVSVLRMLNAEIKNAVIAAGQPLDELQTTQLIRKEIKKRKETAETYRQAGSAERADAEEQEAAILSKYLPADIDPATVEAFLKEEAAKLGTLEPRHRGELIRAAMQKFAGQVDGKTVADIVQKFF